MFVLVDVIIDDYDYDLILGLRWSDTYHSVFRDLILLYLPDLLCTHWRSW